MIAGNKDPRGQAPGHLIKPLAGAVAHTPALSFWSHGDLAVVFSSFQAEACRRQTIVCPEKRDLAVVGTPADHTTAINISQLRRRRDDRGG
jgi:hypothetical protein